jgi:hypothetical protein
MSKDEPKSARSNWQLWKLCQDLSLDEIRVLVSKRKQDIKYEKDLDKIRQLKTDISILTEAYEIIKRRKE